MLKQTSEGVLIFVKVTPRSGFDKVEKIEGEYLKVRLKAIPDKGSANSDLPKVLGDFFNVPPTSIEIISGHTSRLKKVMIRNITLEQVKQKIQHL